MVRGRADRPLQRLLSRPRADASDNVETACGLNRGIQHRAERVGLRSHAWPQRLTRMPVWDHLDSRDCLANSQICSHSVIRQHHSGSDCTKLTILRSRNGLTFQRVYQCSPAASVIPFHPSGVCSLRSRPAQWLLQPMRLILRMPLASVIAYSRSADFHTYWMPSNMSIVSAPVPRAARVTSSMFCARPSVSSNRIRS